MRLKNPSCFLCKIFRFYSGQLFFKVCLHSLESLDLDCVHPRCFHATYSNRSSTEGRTFQWWEKLVSLNQLDSCRDNSCQQICRYFDAFYKMWLLPSVKISFIDFTIINKISIYQWFSLK